MNEELLKQIEALGENEAFQEALSQAETAEDGRKVFDRFGIQLSEGEFNEVISFAKQSSGELSEDSLEDVAGGRLRPVIPVPILPYVVINWAITKILR